LSPLILVLILVASPAQHLKVLRGVVLARVAPLLVVNPQAIRGTASLAGVTSTLMRLTALRGGDGVHGSTSTFFRSASLRMIVSSHAA
jgi:hypothetical protein